MGVGTGGGRLASFAPLIALAKGASKKSTALPRWTGFRHMAPTGGSPKDGTTSFWIGGIEWEHPEAMTVEFAPTLKDAMPIQMDDGDQCFGEDHVAA